MVNLKPTNIDVPMFAYYVDVSGLSRQRAEEMLSELSKKWSKESDYPVIIVPARESKVECIYAGKYHNDDTKVDELIQYYEDEISKSSRPNNPQAEELREELSGLKKCIRRFTNIRKLSK